MASKKENPFYSASRWEPAGNTGRKSGAENRKEDPLAAARRIAVIPACSGAGASFITGLFAAVLREHRRVTVAELGSPYFFDALDMEKRAAGETVRFYDEEKRKEKFREIINLSSGINWALRKPGSGPCKNLSLALRCMNCLPGDTILLDCSGAEAAIRDTVFEEAETRIIVIDPLPSALSGEIPYLEKLFLREQNHPSQETVLVVNKMNAWVQKKELKYVLGTDRYLEMPLLEQALIYKAEYHCLLPADLPESAPQLCAAAKILEYTQNLSPEKAQKLLRKQ